MTRCSGVSSIRFLASFTLALFLLISAPLFAEPLRPASDSEIPPPYQVGTFDEGSPSNWGLWFLRSWKGEDRTLTTVAPFASFQRIKENDEKTSHFLFPFVRALDRPTHWTSDNRKSLSIFPFWHSVSEDDHERGHEWHRYFFPLYYQGAQTDLGTSYFILFPFIWYADNAIVVTPIFPKRPQTFAAFWPFGGQFLNFWNRDKIEFFLWPLYVKSAEGPPEERIELFSFLWPVFGFYKSEVMGGFRFWPFVSRIQRDGEYTRAYWLWPLGHYRSEKVPDMEEPSRMLLFIPFYGWATTPKMKYKLVFPFYGYLNQKGRETKGYALAIYNTDDDLRRGVRKHRLFWILVHWTEQIPVKEEFLRYETEEERRANALQGGGVFPFYIKRTDDTRLRVKIAWPFYTLKNDIYKDYEWNRQYLFPFYGRQTKTFFDTDHEQTNRYVWPFYRETSLEQDHRYYSVPHLFPYTKSEDIDRNWAPLFEMYRKEQNPETGAYSESLFGSVYRHQVDADETSHKQFNIGIFKGKWTRGAESERSGETKYLFGLIKHRW